MQEIFELNQCVDIPDLLFQLNDNILLLQEQFKYLIDIQFNTLVIFIVIVVLGVIYLTFSKFIR